MWIKLGKIRECLETVITIVSYFVFTLFYLSVIHATDYKNSNSDIFLGIY